jgi:hypothetical protein
MVTSSKCPVKLKPSPNKSSGTGGAYRFSRQPTTLFFTICFTVAKEKAHPLQWSCGIVAESSQAFSSIFGVKPS